MVLSYAGVLLTKAINEYGSSKTLGLNRHIRASNRVCTSQTITHTDKETRWGYPIEGVSQLSQIMGQKQIPLY